MPGPTTQYLSDQVDGMRADISGLKEEVRDTKASVRSDVQSVGSEIRSQILEVREEFAGFRGRVEPFFAAIQTDYPKFRDDFASLRSRFELIFSQAKWAMGILTAVGISLVGLAIKVAWDASAIHRDVIQHSEQIKGLTDSVQKLTENSAAIHRDITQHTEQIKGLTGSIQKLTENSARDEQNVARLSTSVERLVGEFREERKDLRGELSAIAAALKGPRNFPDVVKIPLLWRDRLDSNLPSSLAFKIKPRSFSATDDLSLESPGITNLSHRLPLANVRVLSADKDFDRLELLFRNDEDRRSVMDLLDKSVPVHVTLKTTANPPS
jgi:cell division protein FtsB